MRMNMGKTKIMVGGLDLDLLKRSGKYRINSNREKWQHQILDAQAGSLHVLFSS